MASFIQLLVSGLATGAIYALIAVGFTLLWQTSQTINFAQGEFVMLPAFFILAAMNAGAPFWLACLIGIALSIVILGVPVRRMVLYTFLLNAVLVAVASILVSPIYLAKFTNGETLGIAAFIAAIIGGFNQVRGAVLGGVILGVLDNLSAAYISSQYRGAFPLIILIIVILLRPQGLLGRIEER